MRSDRTPAAPRIAVGIPTRGRPAILRALLERLRLQTRPAPQVFVCHADATDLPDLDGFSNVEVIQANLGVCAQRNLILQAARCCDILIYFDDDFVPARRYIEAVATAFTLHPDIVIATGRVVQDGARGPGLSVAEASEILEADRYDGEWPGIIPAWNGYGCNMAIRMKTVRECNLDFDERLKLYAWYEDIDFSRRAARHGRIVRIESARGVHLGTKAGKVSGRRFGYAQVVNPVYLWRKGTYPASHALRSVSRHIAINGVRALWPEPYVDRPGRLLGNGLGLADILRGRIQPERIVDL